LQAAIFAGKIDTVVVWKLDCLVRNLKEGVNVLADWCQRGVRVIAITQQIDLSGPVGNLIGSGIALAKKRGVYTGRRLGPPLRRSSTLVC
jgi:hypothetical protein